ncbi:tudor domain-containing protein 5 [Zerene cesonia]|uniref:tudor domain-containing protein 5 n=1 Tax=Zerene cesonia TaxID=33412 RepID=UPI0018E58C5C|nr:tudor domain-containing protein 5 [Zerene cesonia]
MEEELKKLKSILRSLVVSSPVTVNMTSLLKDYREMVGSPLPLTKFGYRDPLKFLQERCSDCFLFQGPQTNPELILIVPETLKHIDKFVQKQKTSPFVKFRGKRRSVLESNLKPNYQQTNKEEQQTITSVIVQEDEKKVIEKVPGEEESRITNGHHSPEVEINLKKVPPTCQSNQNFINEVESTRSQDYSSGRQTSSSGRSLKEALEEIKEELKTIIYEHPEPVWCSDLLDLYKARYGRELNFGRFGFTSVAGVVCQVAGVRAAQAGGGDWRAWPAAAPPPRPAPRPPRRAPAPAAPAPTDDALPGVAYEPDVFPADCMQLGETISQLPLDDIQEGDYLEVMLGEVYSPSHFWMMRLGEAYNIALDAVMDEMTEYYSRGAGAERRLAAGAVRAGHCCVRHVDYGTVETCGAAGLRALRRRWARLPAQAVRARLAGAAPAAARVWPRPAAAAFLAAVRERRLVAHLLRHHQVNPLSSPLTLVPCVNIATFYFLSLCNDVTDFQEDRILEVLLIDTSTDEDVCIQSELIKAGHAVLRTAPTSSESYLYPKFSALEDGLTPNYAEIHAYIRDGVMLDFVEDGAVSIPASECEIFATLSRVDPAAAQRYMLDAIARAMAGGCTSTTASGARPRSSTLDPNAPEYRAAGSPAAPGMRPPPGFEKK